MKSDLASSSIFMSGTLGAEAPGAGTVLLSRSDVERLLTPDDCIAVVVDALGQYAKGNAPSPGILGHAADSAVDTRHALNGADLAVEVEVFDSE